MMMITSIEQQKNNKNRYSIFIEGEFAFGLDGVDILYYKLKEFDEISQDKVNEIIDNNVYINAKNKALKYLSFKSRTEKEVRIKLEDSDFSNEVIDRVIDFLEKYNYVNDALYAENYLKEKINLNRCGLIRIRRELKSRGVDSEIVDEAIAALEIDESYEVENAVYLINAKLRRIDEVDFKEKNRIFNFLVRKGYSLDIIKDAFSQTGL